MESYPDIRQKIICDKIIVYLKHIYDELPLEDQHRSKNFHQSLCSEIKFGLCFGLSILYSYMVSVDKGEWWFDLIGNFCSWDGQKESLTLDKRIQYERLINYVLFNQADYRINGISDLSQRSFLRAKKGIFDSEHGKIKYRLFIGGYFTEARFCELFQPEVLFYPGIYLISSGSHAAAIKYDGTFWYLYDPNFSNGAAQCENAQALYRLVTISLGGNSFIFRLASWDKRTKVPFENLKNAFTELVSTDPTAMIQGKGLGHFFESFSYVRHLLLNSLKVNECARHVFYNSLSIQLNSSNTILFVIIALVSKKFLHQIIQITLLESHRINQFKQALHVGKPETNALCLMELLCPSLLKRFLKRSSQNDEKRVRSPEVSPIADRNLFYRRERSPETFGDEKLTDRRPHYSPSPGLG